jgi:hypothetical protein
MKHGRLTRLALFASADGSDWREVGEMAGRRAATNTKPGHKLGFSFAGSVNLARLE